MNKRERAKLVQDEGFLAELSKGTQLRLFNQWLSSDDAEDRERLHSAAVAVQEAVRQIAAWSNEYKQGQR